MNGLNAALFNHASIKFPKMSFSNDNKQLSHVTYTSILLYEAFK